MGDIKGNLIIKEFPTGKATMYNYRSTYPKSKRYGN